MNDLSKEIKNYLKSTHTDFKRFKMNYDKKEINQINTFNLNKLTNHASFSYFGSYEKLTNIKPFLSELGENDVKLVGLMEKLIIKIIKRVLSGYNMKHFWIDIRASPPNNAFDIPRWHKDGSYFNPNEQLTSKYITVLKGPGTLLIKGTKRVNTIYNEHNQKNKNEIHTNTTIEDQIKICEKYRPILAKALSEEKIIQLKNNQGVVLYAGIPADKCAIHSEPKIDNYRLFISILPGSEENITRLQKKWGK